MYILIRGKQKIIITSGRNKCYLRSLAVRVSTLNVQHCSASCECPLNVLSRGLKKHEQKELNSLTSPREGGRQRGSCRWCPSSAQVTPTQERVANFGKWQHVKQVPAWYKQCLCLARAHRGEASVHGREGRNHTLPKLTDASKCPRDTRWGALQGNGWEYKFETGQSNKVGF